MRSGCGLLRQVILRFSFSSAILTQSTWSLDGSIAYIESQIALLAMTEDAKKGFKAFSEKRMPSWPGRWGRRDSLIIGRTDVANLHVGIGVIVRNVAKPGLRRRPWRLYCYKSGRQIGH